jgi:FkbM family methyltransferase
MKKIVKSFIRKFGIDIIRYGNPQKTTRNNKLSFYKTKTGNYYLPTDAHQDAIAFAIRNDLIFDSEVLEAAKKHIKPNTCVLEIGSNFGQMAILMSKLVGDKGIVHSFEADDFVFKILEKNIRENSRNVVAHYGAVHDKGGETLYFPIQDFEEMGTYGSYGIDYLHNKGRPVKTIAIDDINYELPVSFVKIDIQGGDLFALKGAIKTINKFRMPIIFEYEYSFEDKLNLCFQDYIDFVKSINYKFAKVVSAHNYLILPND